MKLNALVVHKLIKEANGVPSIEFADALLPVGADETEFVSVVSDAYYKKSNPVYGVFDANKASYPYQDLLTSYLTDPKTFYNFSKSAMNHLSATVTDIPMATGGYTLFAHYESKGETFCMVTMINDKNHFNVNDHLIVKKALGLDIERLDVANAVNISRWQKKKEGENYLSFVGGRKEISNYFLKFVGCTDRTEAKETSANFKRVFYTYVDTLGLSADEEDSLKKKVSEYAIEQVSKGDDIFVNHISSLINADEPRLFLEYAVTEENGVSSAFKGHRQTFRSMTQVSYSSRKLSVRFDTSLLGNTVFYDDAENQLRITEVPDNLKRQIQNQNEEDEVNVDVVE